MKRSLPAIFALGVLGVLAVPAVAHAEAVAYGYYEDPEPERPKNPWQKARLEGAVGALVGGQRIGWIRGTAGGLHVDAGFKMDRLFLYGEYDFLGVGETASTTPAPGDPTVRGFMHRVSANVRYSLAAFGGGGEVPVRGDVWAEIGGGHQHVRWHEGGKLGRKDISFGFGAQATFKIGRDKPKFLGIYYAVKMTIARAPEPKSDDPTCAGPCDEPTPPSPWDVGIFFNFGVPFGR